MVLVARGVLHIVWQYFISLVALCQALYTVLAKHQLPVHLVISVQKTTLALSICCQTALGNRAGASRRVCAGLRDATLVDHMDRFLAQMPIIACLFQSREAAPRCAVLVDQPVINIMQHRQSEIITNHLLILHHEIMTLPTRDTAVALPCHHGVLINTIVNHSGLCFGTISVR